MDSAHTDPLPDQDWWQRLLRRARDVAERIEGRVLGVMNKYSANGADRAAELSEPEGGTPHADGG